MESSNYTEPFFGIPCLGKEDQAYLSLAGSPRNAGASALVQAHLCLHRMIRRCFKLPCLETHLTNPFPAVSVLLPQFPVLILMLGSLSLPIFQPRMPIFSTHCWLPMQANLCPTGSCSTEIPPLMPLGQHVPFQHSSGPISQKHLTKQLPVRMGLQVAWDTQQHFLLLALGQMRCSCLTH